MLREPEYISRSAAGRLLGVNQEKVALFIKTDLFPKNQAGKPLYSKVKELAAVTKTYNACTPDEFFNNQNTAYFVPISNSSKGIHLGLSTENEDYRYIANGLKAGGFSLPTEVGITDGWSISDKNATALISRQGLMFGITTGFVVEVARVVGLAYLNPLDKTKHFLIQKLSDSERDSLQGRLVDQISQTGRYYWL